MTASSSIDETRSYNETRIDYHTAAAAAPEDISDIYRKTINLEVINRSELPNGKILPESIASFIDANRASSIPHFILIDNKSGIIGYGLPSYWKLTSKPFTGNFTCKANMTTGWQDNTSLQVTTKIPTNNKGPWSSIRGQEIGVKPNERYELVTHMKLNDLARESHIKFEGYDKTLKNWVGIKQCPPGINRSLEWHEFSCELTIPINITKMRPVLNAGWSSQENKEATTWFDDVYMIQLADENFQPGVPTITNDPNLKIELVAAGLEQPTSMSFLGPDDILVLEKNNGTVRRIINGTVSDPLLDFNVGNLRERGLLGIAIAAKNESSNTNATTNTGNSTHVFLYLSESKNGDTDRPEPLSNRLYRYDLENNKLVNPKLLLELPVTARPIHNGGIVLIGPDNNVYTVVGDLEGQTNTTKYQGSKLQRRART